MDVAPGKRNGFIPFASEELGVSTPKPLASRRALRGETQASKRLGFTMLELAVVMVVIALLAGAIVTTQTMIRNSQIQSALAEYDAHVKAVVEFRDKFSALPGDMKNAQDMWGVDPSGCPATPSSSAIIRITCNGDGNGTIGTSTAAAALSNSHEWFRAWQQLSNAGFIKGLYTGTRGSGSASEARIGTNIPASILNNAGWTLLYYLQTANNVNFWGDSYGHIFTLGSFRTNTYATNSVLSVNEALAIDRKIDDGFPGLGAVRAWRATLLPGCTKDSGTVASHAYDNTSSNSNVCSLIFIPGF